MDMLAWVAALTGAAGAVFAGWQISLSRSDRLRAATFEHLREIDRRLQAVWCISVTKAIDAISQSYISGNQTLSEDAARYLALLNSLDLLALEMETQAVNLAIADDFLSSLCRKGFIDRSMLVAIQKAWNDPKIYRHLLNYFDEYNPIADDEANVAPLEHAVPAEARIPAPQTAAAAATAPHKAGTGAKAQGEQ